MSRRSADEISGNPELQAAHVARRRPAPQLSAAQRDALIIEYTRQGYKPGQIGPVGLTRQGVESALERITGRPARTGAGLLMSELDELPAGAALATARALSFVSAVDLADEVVLERLLLECDEDATRLSWYPWATFALTQLQSAKFRRRFRRATQVGMRCTGRQSVDSWESHSNSLDTYRTPSPVGAIFH
jgi:hypothetical protein